MKKSYSVIICASLVFTHHLLAQKNEYIYGEQKSSATEQIQAIDFQIIKLNKLLAEYRLEAEQTDIKSQGNMFDKWDTFAHGIEDSEAKKLAAKRLEVRINDLVFKKNELMQKE